MVRRAPAAGSRRRAFRRFFHADAQCIQRAALGLVRVGDAGDVVERPVSEFRTLLGAAAHELVDDGREGTPSAARAGFDFDPPGRMVMQR
jgi:hypothetical protein